MKSTTHQIVPDEILSMLKQQERDEHVESPPAPPERSITASNAADMNVVQTKADDDPEARNQKQHQNDIQGGTAEVETHQTKESIVTPLAEGGKNQKVVTRDDNVPALSGTPRLAIGINLEVGSVPGEFAAAPGTQPRRLDNVDVDVDPDEGQQSIEEFQATRMSDASARGLIIAQPVLDDEHDLVEAHAVDQNALNLSSAKARQLRKSIILCCLVCIVMIVGIALGLALGLSSKTN